MSPGTELQCNHICKKLQRHDNVQSGNKQYISNKQECFVKKQDCSKGEEPKWRVPVILENATIFKGDDGHK